MFEGNPEMQDTLKEGRRLWRLLWQYARLEAVDRLAVVLTMAISAAVLFTLLSVATLCLAMAAVHWLAEVVGDTAISYAIVGAAFALLGLLAWLLRGLLVTRPVIRMLMETFFPDEVNARKGTKA